MFALPDGFKLQDSSNPSNALRRQLQGKSSTPYHSEWLAVRHVAKKGADSNETGIDIVLVDDSLVMIMLGYGDRDAEFEDVRKPQSDPFQAA
jgi:hypothetical protein